MGKRRTLPLWQALLVGPFLIGFGIWEYLRLADLEQNGGVEYVDRFTAFFYGIGGKNAALVVTAGLGVLYIVLLAHWWRATRAAEKKLAAMESELPVPEPRKERPLRRRGDAPIAPPPAADGGPFRGSGASAPVQVIRTERPAPRAEVVPGEGGDRGPSILR